MNPTFFGGYFAVFLGLLHHRADPGAAGVYAAEMFVGVKPLGPQSRSSRALIPTDKLRGIIDRASRVSNKFQIRISVWSVEATAAPRALRSSIQALSLFV